MASLKKKVKHALDEVRTLVLGAQVLLAFQLTATLERPFEEYPFRTQVADLVALVATAVALAILLAPVARHRIVEKGEPTLAMLEASTAAARVALVPIAGVIGFDVFFVTRSVLGFSVGVAFGVATTAIGLAMFYGIEAVRKRSREHEEDLQRVKRMSEKQGNEGVTTEDKVEHVLTETRVVLPGVQALLGFQFSAVLLGGFEKLPHHAKLVHVGSLVAMSLGAILLMAPAAYHRIVEGGEDTEHFHRVASRMVLASLVPVAIGIASELFVVACKVLGSNELALAMSVALLAIFAAAWGVYPLVEKRRRGVTRSRRPAAEGDAFPLRTPPPPAESR